MWTLAALLVLAAGSQEPGQAASAPALEGFRYAPGRLALGRVYRYRKSNLDGSNPSQIALHLASETRLESLKWHAEEPVATLVVAEMDWEVCSVRAFRNFRVEADGARSLVAELVVTPDRKRVVGRLGEQEFACELERFPWHSYDFDLASLNVALRFLMEPEGEVELGIVDPVQGPDGPGLAAKGSVFLAYEAHEERNGLACRRYTLDGPGLEERGGKLWASAGDEVFLVAYEIALPDEPGMSSGRLEWIRNETLSAGEWEGFVKERRDAGR